VGAVIMLEAADPGVTAYINTMDEAMEWVRRIANPAFGVMLDTYELAESAPSLEYGIRAASGQARHGLHASVSG
jgi:sugar phosphate isomerase/epimerase